MAIAPELLTQQKLHLRKAQEPELRSALSQPVARSRWLEVGKEE
jgi:hypothetical protein